MGNKIYEYPRWIVFQLLEKCNLRCKMCYEWGESGSYLDKNDLKELDIDIVKKVIYESAPYNPFFELFGGEPLLYRNIEDILMTVNKVNGKISIPTNGTLVEQYAESIIKYSVNKIWISIDGPESYNDAQRGKGVFKRAVRGIETLYRIKKEKGTMFPEIGITMVVTPNNYKTIEELFINQLNPDMLDWISIEFQLYITEERYSSYCKFAKDNLGVINPLSAKGYLREVTEFQSIDIDELIRQINIVKDYCTNHMIKLIGYPKYIEKDNLLYFYTGQWDKMKEKKKRCSLPWVYAEISASGNVTPCHTFYDYSLGNIYNQSLKEIWNSEKIREFRKCVQNLMPVCIACSRYYSDL